MATVALSVTKIISQIVSGTVNKDKNVLQILFLYVMLIFEILKLCGETESRATCFLDFSFSCDSNNFAWEILGVPTSLPAKMVTAVNI